eukprot:TRINITY_DN48006_c0_g1_i1.p1 TRINITY_DN48006_c0_g1~~TRINITY_DN48006_c0_g1_i1.p1  ORF type:complete len:498 (-),score=43.03 TRINITY_DN48006_c0_g1_i1:344-1780(-)
MEQEAGLRIDAPAIQNSPTVALPGTALWLLFVLSTPYFTFERGLRMECSTEVALAVEMGISTFLHMLSYGWMLTEAFGKNRILGSIFFALLQVAAALVSLFFTQVSRVACALIAVVIWVLPQYVRAANRPLALSVTAIAVLLRSVTFYLLSVAIPTMYAKRLGFCMPALATVFESICIMSMSFFFDRFQKNESERRPLTVFIAGAVQYSECLRTLGFLYFYDSGNTDEAGTFYMTVSITLTYSIILEVLRRNHYVEAIAYRKMGKRYSISKDRDVVLRSRFVFGYMPVGAMVLAVPYMLAIRWREADRLTIAFLLLVALFGQIIADTIVTGVQKLPGETMSESFWRLQNPGEHRPMMSLFHTGDDEQLPTSEVVPAGSAATVRTGGTSNERIEQPPRVAWSSEPSLNEEQRCDSERPNSERPLHIASADPDDMFYTLLCDNPLITDSVFLIFFCWGSVDAIVVSVFNACEWNLHSNFC